MAKKDDGLTPLQARFVEEYLIDLKAGPAYKRRGLNSPNRADALCLSFAFPVQSKNQIYRGQQQKLPFDYDPLEMS